MCAPGSDMDDIKEEASLLEVRHGMSERRMSVNGKMSWDWFWRFLSVLAVPWATAVSIMLWNLSMQSAETAKALELKGIEYERRLEALEVQMDPSTRFYRWDGEALGERLTDLEDIHPRTTD